MKYNYRQTNIARKVAKRFMSAYRAKGPLEKVIGKILTRSLGITDAPKEFFEEAVGRIEEVVEETGLDLDLKDVEVYPYIQRVVREVADEQGLF